MNSGSWWSRCCVLHAVRIGWPVRNAFKCVSAVPGAVAQTTNPRGNHLPTSQNEKLRYALVDPLARAGSAPTPFAANHPGAPRVLSWGVSHRHKDGFPRRFFGVQPTQRLMGFATICTTPYGRGQPWGQPSIIYCKTLFIINSFCLVFGSRRLHHKHHLSSGLGKYATTLGLLIGSGYSLRFPA